MYIYISSMSKPQAKVYDAISAASEQICIHIAKIMLFPDSPHVDHWMHEVWSFLPRVSRIKGSNKLPKSSMILKALSEENDALNSYLIIAEDMEDTLDPTDVTLSTYTSVVVTYQHWLATMLASNEQVRQADVKSMLTDLIFN